MKGPIRTFASVLAFAALAAMAGCVDSPPQPGDAPGTGSDAADVEQAIDTVLGDHRDYREVFDRLQQAMASGDKAGVAALVAYPIGVMLHGEPKEIGDAQALIADWDEVVTPEIEKAVADQKFSEVFVNAQGVMLGDGQVWLSGVCRDETCSASDVRVITIQPVPQDGADPSAAAVDAGPTCSGADLELGDARREEYAKLVAGALDGEVDSGSIQVVRSMRIDAWSVVFATTPVSDPGWFVFESVDERKQFKDVWGGMALEDDRPGLVEWATGLGAPADFAACFAETVIN